MTTASKVMLATCLAMLFLALPSVADDARSPLFIKVFAGESLTSRRDFNKAVRRNLKAKAEIPDSSIIPCEAGKYYGLGVIVSAPGKQFLSFETTAIWRDLDNYDKPRRSAREHTLKKDEYGTRRFFFKIRNKSVDHDMTFIAHIGKQVYLRHKFHIRGCKNN